MNPFCDQLKGQLWGRGLNWIWIKGRELVPRIKQDPGKILARSLARWRRGIRLSLSLLQPPLLGNKKRTPHLCPPGPILELRFLTWVWVAWARLKDAGYGKWWRWRWSWSVTCTFRGGVLHEGRKRNKNWPMHPRKPHRKVKSESDPHQVLEGKGWPPCSSWVRKVRQECSTSEVEL